MYNVSFLGLKENIAYGHQAINSVKKDFPAGFMSNTYYETFSKEKDDKTLCFYQDLIESTRELVDFKKRQGKTKKEATYEAVKYTGAANCGEQALLISQKLDELGVKNDVISMQICKTGKSYYHITNGHSFCVIDTAEDMDVNNPDTWGNDAVVVDMWSNTVAKAKDAIAFFSTFLIPKENEKIRFETAFPY